MPSADVISAAARGGHCTAGATLVRDLPSVRRMRPGHRAGRHRDLLAYPMAPVFNEPSLGPGVSYCPGDPRKEGRVQVNYLERAILN